MTEDEEIANVYKDFMEDIQKKILDRLTTLDKVPYSSDVPYWFYSANKDNCLRIKEELAGKQDEN